MASAPSVNSAPPPPSEDSEIGFVPRLVFFIVLASAAVFLPSAFPRRSNLLTSSRRSAPPTPEPTPNAAALVGSIGAGHHSIGAAWKPRPHRSLATAPVPTNVLRVSGKHWAQEEEDLEAYSRYFYGLENGVILESGALDGVQYSTSKMFVESLGWSAVHVEANPSNYKLLVANRPESADLNVALCDKSTDLHFVFREESTDAVSGIWEFMPQFIKDKWWADVTPERLKAFPTVPCRPLPPMLRALGVNHINFWVLDVEGAELEVLHAMDFSAIRVDVMVVELDGSNLPKDNACRALLDKAGFEVVGSWQGSASRNNWFVNRAYEPMEELHGDRSSWHGGGGGRRLEDAMRTALGPFDQGLWAAPDAVHAALPSFERAPHTL